MSLPQLVPYVGFHSRKKTKGNLQQAFTHVLDSCKNYPSRYACTAGRVLLLQSNLLDVSLITIQLPQDMNKRS